MIFKNIIIIFQLFLICSHVAAAETNKIQSTETLSQEKIQLGQMLFFDQRLSKTKTVSCSSCHNVISTAGRPASGTDGLSVSVGINGLQGQRNAPTVLNAALRTALFWDGRASSLEEQAKGPLVNPIEMSMENLNEVVRTVDSIKLYREKFKSIYGKNHSTYKITIDDIAAAIATYERTLITVNSKFDRFRSGDESALSEIEKRGWKKFNKFACIACHGAPTFLNQDYFVRFPQRTLADSELLHELAKDTGRFNVTKNPADINKWRVPSLKNVELTGPYFHNGSVRQLDEAVRLMAKAQIGIILKEDDVQDIVAFLKTLSDETPKQTVPKIPK